MELFLQNLPPHITDNDLKRHLTPFVSALGIKDWSSQKQRKKNFGSITFLHLNDGERFQREHGQPILGGNRSHYPKRRSSLVILDTPAYCKPSKYDPDPFLLKSLAKSAEDREEAEQ